MGKYFGVIKDVQLRDELFGGDDGVAVSKRNIEVEGEIKRGMLLSADKAHGVYKLATVADASKAYVIAAEDFEASETSKVTQAYSSGKFNRERVQLAEGLNIDDFEELLRREGIILTTIQDKFGKVYDWAIGN